MECENNGLITVKYSDIAKAKQREYYQKNKEIIKDKARIKSLLMTEEEKQKQREKYKIRRDHMSDEKRQKLKVYMKNYGYNKYHNDIAYAKN